MTMKEKQEKVRTKIGPSSHEQEKSNYQRRCTGHFFQVIPQGSFSP